ncbi:GTPase-activating protein [Linnemannia exigua]|uniref:GTPase-activating protein n=1 Tax=Linnemannia exigua TaxID=604196 RepID=A0AAD4DBX7_9FUNG|nr:GTPase-activating protein [Linnemannia exigua]
MESRNPSTNTTLTLLLRLHPSFSTRVGFWKRHTSKHPGSVKPVPGKTGATGNMVFGAQYSHATSVLEVERLRALQMDPASWASEHNKSIVDDDYDSNYDNHPELSGYQTLPAQDLKDDSELDAGSSLSPTTPSGPTGLSEQMSKLMKDESFSPVKNTPTASGATKDVSPSSASTATGNGVNSAIRAVTPGAVDEKTAPSGTPSGDIEGMKPNARNIMQDPLVILRGLDYETAMGDLHLIGTEHQADAVYALQRSKQKARFLKFKDMLQQPVVDLDVLRKLSWSGVPTAIRPIVWQLLVGYLPCNSDRRNVALERKRKEYQDGVQQTFARGIEGLDQTIWHQVFIDVPRTNPKMALFQNQTTQRCLERILYCWAIRHPASSYVQGINDLVTPFFLVFLTAYIEEDQDPESYDISLLPPEILSAIEADSYWCLSKLLDGIQDNFTHAQPGIQRQIVKLRELICRIDAPLAAHLQSEHVEFIQFSFRWMNCLLMREVTLQHTIRMWDTYLTEHPHGFSEFHLYVCAAFLTKWSAELMRMEFQEIMLFLQDVPTDDWQEKEIELLLSEAFMWKSLFHASPMHLGGSK